MAKRNNLTPERWSQERVTKMLSMVKAGMNFGAIATELGVSRMAAYSKWYNMENPEPHRAKLENRNRQIIERTGKFWRLGCANPRENSLHMRRDYLKMTAHLLEIHGNPKLPREERLKEQIFAKFNLDIPNHA